MTDFITNSTSHATAQNYFHEGKIYSYRIAAGEIECQVDNGDYIMIPRPSRQSIKKIAADNNRLFVLTNDNKLYWRCMLKDAASWVIFLYTVIEFSGDGMWDNILFLLIGDNFTIDGERYPDFKAYARAYRTKAVLSHDKRWNLLNKEGIVSDDIVDIAVGNWNQSVVTYYVLSKSGEVFYTDEEPVIRTWHKIEGDNKPDDLDENSRICASHSVVAATAGNKIHWIRMDAHNPIALPLGFLSFNFTEVWYTLDGHQRANHPGWHTAVAPTLSIDEFIIDVGCGECWPLLEPNQLLTPLHEIVEACGEMVDAFRNTNTECGFLGGMEPNLPRYSYPFCCIIKSGENYKHILLPESSKQEIEAAEWEDVEINACQGFVGNSNTMELHRPLCSRVKSMNRAHMRLYATLEDALAHGYDGCYYCLRAHSKR